MMKKFLALAMILALTELAFSADFQDDFTKRPRTDTEKLGYAIWGDAAILKCVSYDKETGNKAPGSMKFDGSKVKEGENVSGFLVKTLPVTPGQKYNVMVKVLKKELVPETNIVVRITLSDSAGKGIPDTMLQRVQKTDLFEDNIWKTVTLTIDIPNSGKYANAASGTVLFGVSALKKGTVYFDDLEFFAEEK